MTSTEISVNSNQRNAERRRHLLISNCENLKPIHDRLPPMKVILKKRKTQHYQKTGRCV
jgi:hypothetical protein